jgi:hypothetical protein
MLLACAHSAQHTYVQAPGHVTSSKAKRACEWLTGRLSVKVCAATHEAIQLQLPPCNVAVVNNCATLQPQGGSYGCCAHTNERHSCCERRHSVNSALMHHAAKEQGKEPSTMHNNCRLHNAGAVVRGSTCRGENIRATPT